MVHPRKTMPVKQNPPAPDLATVIANLQRVPPVVPPVPDIQPEVQPEAPVAPVGV
ncbi:hypothetical protein TIFTF001_039945 [Ficus carica]|uniref:Uncharacterized protein n=1 Tax=Ficus carica TaxID=3494 RepID=A0AA87Z7F9_FICCA|nr:hypothetical protein TIFTF001_039945 [Ficus carica]